MYQHGAAEFFQPMRKKSDLAIEWDSNFGVKQTFNW